MIKTTFYIASLFCTTFALNLNAALPKPWDGENYDESKVPNFKLPNVLAVPSSSDVVKSAFEWNQKVRPQLQNIFQDQLYGFMPPRPQKMSFEIREESDNALGGIAIRRQIRIHLEDKGGKHFIDMILYIPKNAKKPVPVINGLNFCGNHTIIDEKEVFMPDGWVRNTTYPKMKVTNNKPKEADRNSMDTRWPIKKILNNGFAFSCAHYGDIYPDDEKVNRSADSIYKIFDKNSKFSSGPATIAWAWGHSRMIDCLEAQPEIDSKKIAITGHSRLARTVVLAGALDDRVAMVLANNPGEMGTALSRRCYGERIENMNRRFPFWFSPNLKKFSNNEENMPVDQHQLVACIAPRLIYVASAELDYWGDPKGELQGLVEAGKVFGLYGAKNLPNKDALELNKRFIGDVGYHRRSGKHDMTEFDWDGYLEFAKHHGW